MRNAENCLSLTRKLEREDAFPILLHVCNCPSIQRRRVQRFVEASKRRVSWWSTMVASIPATTTFTQTIG